MKIIILIVTLQSFLVGVAQKTFIEPSDIAILNRTEWKGQLTYKDYQSGEWTPVEATMQISVKGAKIKTSIQYSYEPNKNRTSTVKLKDGGNYYGNERVLSNELRDDYRLIKTTYKGKDDNRNATIFITYKFNSEQYIITKEVLYYDSNTKIIRNKYEFHKL